MAVSKLFVLVASVMFVLDGFDGTKAQEAAQNVLTARMLPYNPEDIDWNMRMVGTFCATQDADKPLEWLQQHGWAATCGVTPCGSCVQVTNPKTGASTVARVVDQCHYMDVALELGFSVFKQIDRDGHGKHDDGSFSSKKHDGSYSLDVDFNFVDCQD